METAGSVILCLTPDPRVSEFNHETEIATGWLRGEVLGDDFQIGFAHAAARERFKKELVSVFDGLEVWSARHPTVHAVGQATLGTQGP